MSLTYSPLRYPGGKTQLSGFIIEILRSNQLFNGTYVEPFAGGAGIAWKLLLDGYVSKVVINDIDPAIYAFWAAVLRHTDAFCERIENTSVTIEEWYRQKLVQKQSRPKQLDLAFSTFFLNRTNRSGIIKAGVIGGVNQKGNYLIDCRFNKKNLIKKIKRIALYKNQIKLTKLDGKEFIKQLPKLVEKNSFINIDPPYYAKGPELYCSFYNHQDHVDLSRAVKELKYPWILTYDDVPEVRALYSENSMYNKELNYFA